MIERKLGRFIFGIIAIVTIFSLFDTFYHKSICEEVRYAFDFGSGAIKSHAANVDKCTGKIVKILGKSIEKHTSFEKCYEINQHGKKVISQACIENAKTAFEEIEKDLKISCKTAKCSGIATAWARKAVNAQEVIEIFREKGVNLKAVTQEEEGIIAFKSVLASIYLRHVNPNEVIVFDIGGGSFQFVTLHGGKHYVYSGKYGIFNFEDEVRKRYNIAANAPLPYLSDDTLEHAFESASYNIGKKLLQDPVLSRKLKNPKVKIYAIGAPLSKGFKDQMSLPSDLHKDDVKKAARVFSYKTSEELYGKVYPKLPKHYVPSAQKACILMYGIMNGANIERIKILDAMVADALLVNNEPY